MASLNKVMIIGFLGADPDKRFTSDGGLAITTISVATNRNYRNQSSGELVTETEWHRIVFFGKQAETISTYLRKGSQVFVEGRIRTRKWEKDGVTHYTTEIIGENFQFIDRKSDSSGDAYGGYDVPPEYKNTANASPYGAPQPSRQSSFEKPRAERQAPQRQASQQPSAPVPPQQDPFNTEEDIPF